MKFIKKKNIGRVEQWKKKMGKKMLYNIERDTEISTTIDGNNNNKK